MKKKLALFMACMLLFNVFNAIFLCNDMSLQAASEYQVIEFSSTNNDVKVGNTVFRQNVTAGLTATTNGRTVLISAPGGTINNILTNGVEVYFCKLGYNFEKEGILNIYRIRVDGTGYEKVFSVKSKRKTLEDWWEYFKFAGYYDGNIYYVKNAEPKGDFCSYSLKTEKQKVI